MPSAQPQASVGSDIGEMAKRKEALGLTGKMRRTLKRMGGKFPKELPAQDDPAQHSGHSVDTIIPRLSEDPEVEREMREIKEVNGSRQQLLPSENRSNKLYRQNGSANYERCREHNGSTVCSRTESSGHSVAMANGVYATAESRTDEERSNERVSQNGEHNIAGDGDSVRERKATSSNGLAMFEKQGARPKTGLYRKKSSPVGKNIEFGVTAVVLNVQANRSGEDGKGNDVVADFQLRVGGLCNEEDSETSSNPVPLPGKGSMRNDISVKLSPGFGGNLNSDVTLNCSVNVHCHISGVDAVAEEGEDRQDDADGVDGDVENEKWLNQRSKFMSSTELEPLVIQMGQQSDSEVPSNPRTPHIAEVVMRDSLSNMESDSADKVQKGEEESLGRDCRPQPKGHKDASVHLNSAKEVAEKMKHRFEEVVLLPKDSQIIDVVTGHRDPTYDEDDMRLEYSLPRSVSDGAAILSRHRNDESFKDKALLGPAVDRRTKPKSMYGDYAHPEGSPADEDDSPPPIPPRISVPNQETKKEDWETEPTHMCLPALMNGLYHDNSSSTSASTRSKSLPRHSSLNDVSMDPTGPRRSKTAHLKNRVSQLFKTPRRKSCAFPDRPLPDVPAIKVAVHQRENRRSQVQRPQSLYCPTDGRNPVLPPPPARPCPQRPSTTIRQTPSRQGHENMVVIEMGEGFPTKEELARCRGEFASSLRRISECGWYWGPMSWDDAEMRLENTPDGSFLVRDSSDDRHILSLTFRVQGSTHHTRIEHHNGKFSFWSQPTTHGSSSIVEFIEEAMRHSRNGRFLYFLRPRWPGLPPIPLQLLYPISRFQKARSLQHMCRFVIRRHVRLDHIDALPLPRRLKEYLREGQYYTPDDIKP